MGRGRKPLPTERNKKMNKLAEKIDLEVTKLAFDFSFDSEGFWFRNEKIYSGNVHKYYDEIIRYDIDSFAEWVYNNDFQYKLGLEV